ncbi:MAG: preprotein translocase subunit SecA [Pirellulaceae bacterium]
MFHHCSVTIDQIRHNADKLHNQTDAALRDASLELKYLAMAGASADQLIPRGFALVTEAVRRTLGLNYYDVQLEGGIRLAAGAICEMKTGEGKTITAALPAFLSGLSGLGSHVITVNDYLARRDHEILQPVYQLLGLTSGVILDGQPPAERMDAYRCDITYGTAKQFGFDFLRDRLTLRDSQSSSPRLLQRELHAALVDEVDSILIDEARTPLIIGAIDQAEMAVSQDCFVWAAKHAGDYVENVDFVYDQMLHHVSLTTMGFQRMCRLPGESSAIGFGTSQVSTAELKQYAENAIHVLRNMHRDKHYTIDNGKIVIVDEFTGRPAEGRQWQAGIHQAVEAKEGREISPRTDSAASVTIQHFFRLYRQLCGMTGTAVQSRREFKKVYQRAIVAVPTHRPVRRKQYVTRVFCETESKFHAAVKETQRMLELGRPVLIGTRVVAKSELLSQFLTDAGIPHQVLNARFLSAEAEIVAKAGQAGAVTVATNMAGRGTDIHLEADVIKAGGLHVLLTEIHESSRIDLQLIGRCSRQGDPGSYQIMVSLDDEILIRGLGERRAATLAAKFSSMGRENGELPIKLFDRFVKAQRRTEHKHFVDRMALLRREKDRSESMFESGQDIYLDSLR